MDGKIRTLKEMPVNIFDMALTKSTDILLSIYGSSDVKLLKKSGEIKQFPSVAQLLPTGKKTKSTDILLCIYGSSDVKLLTKSGEIKQFPSVAQLPTGKKTKNTDILPSIYGSSDVKLLTVRRNKTIPFRDTTTNWKKNKKY